MSSKDKIKGQERAKQGPPTIPAEGMPPKIRQWVQTFRWVVEVISRLYTPVRLVLAVVGLVVAAYYGYRLRDRILYTQEHVAGALQSKLESTAHPHKGVAAFLLSGLDATLPPRDSTSSGSRVPTVIGEMVKQLENFTREVKSFKVDQVLNSLSLTLNGTASDIGWEKAIIAKRSSGGFLMVPVMSIRRKGLLESAMTEDVLKTALQYNPEILFDLHVASNLQPDLKKLDALTFGSLSVVQGYFITESGVIVLRATKPGIEDQNKYYQDQFAPYTLFMDRPYFQRAVQPELILEDYGPFDYRTEPYIDLGGNGLVITYSKRVDLPNHRVGILCVDTRLPERSFEEIGNRLKALGADFGEFWWAIGGGTEGSVPNDFQWFEKRLHNGSQRDQSRFLGAIGLESDNPHQAAPKGKPGIVRFTLPLESTQGSNGLRKTKLLWVRIDFASIQKNVTWDLFLFSGGIILALVVGYSILRDLTVLKRQMSRILEKMSRVMADARTPFAWLNEKNEFHEVNQKFLEVVGHSNLDDLKRRTPTFIGLLTPASQRKYREDVLNASARGEDTGEYDIDVIKENKEIIHVWAHGERIPYPTFFKIGLPHRFGIFVRWEGDESEGAAKEVVPPAPASPPKSLGATSG